MKSVQMKKETQDLARVHDELGSSYLELCETSAVDPFPVLWMTYPPRVDGHTQAYLMYGYDGEEDEEGNLGIDVHAEDRAELVHKVFLRALILRSVN